MLEFLQLPDEPDDSKPQRFATDVPLGEKAADTVEDEFRRQHDALINSEAVEREKEITRQFRLAQEERVEAYRPFKQRKAELRAERILQDEQRRAASLERREEARRAAKERSASAVDSKQPQGAKIFDFAEEKKKKLMAAKSTTGGQNKPYVRSARATYFLEQVRAKINERYDEMEDAIIAMQARTKEIDKEIKELSDKARTTRHEFGEKVKEVRRPQLGVLTSDTTREVTRLRTQLFKEGASIRTQTSRLRSEKANLNARINTKKSELIRFKRLVDQTRRIYDNRNSRLSNTYADLERLHDELRRWHIYLPALRLREPGGASASGGLSQAA